MLSLEDLWPPFALAIRCGPLELRAVRDDDLPALVDAASRGVHDDALRPFPRAWVSQAPLAMGRDLAQCYWRHRGGLPGEEWALPLVVRLDGRIVGVQGAEAQHYPVLRTPDTFSWLTRDVQGRGVGTRMRQAICAFLFDELDAAVITSGAYVDNPASAAVSRKVGFTPNGGKPELRDGAAAEHQRFILTRETFVRSPDPVEIVGAEAMRDVAGVRRG